jgi:asparagine synthase (glutamine-hydrolysing)
MCGICGIVVNSERSLSDVAERTQWMCNAQAHRGPDDAGCWVSRDGRVSVGNRRLAICDLSPAGHTPISNTACTVWITYNGEVYNTDELRCEVSHAH